jgi:hypothetical protein
MVCQSELAEGILDRLLIGIAGNTEDFIIVALCNFGDTPPSLVLLA